jgi:GT2 family glycosyltransferase
MSAPTVSVVVVNFDGESYLPRMRDALLATEFPFFEIIVCDDVSRDGSRLWLRHEWPEARVLRAPRNSGCAAMRNLGLRVARGEYVLLLDNDALPERGCVHALVAALSERPACAAAMPRIVLRGATALVQCDGAYTHPTGQMGLATPHTPLGEAPLKAVPITSVMGTAMLLRREAALRAGAFAEDFFIYYEDHEFGTRLVMLEGDVISVPEARIDHLGGTKSLSFRTGQHYPDRRAFLIARNRQRFMLRALECRTLLVLAPILILHEFAQVVWSLLAGRIAHWCDATWDNLRQLARILNERHWIQQRRRLHDRALIRTGPLPVHPGLLTRPWQRELVLRFAACLDGMYSTLSRFLA